MGPCASVLCVVHCFSLPLLLLLAPGVFHVVPYQFLHELEIVFWILAVELGFYTLTQASISPFWRKIFVALSLLAPVGMLLGSPNFTHAVFIAMALMQFTLVILSHLHRNRPVPQCCEGHEH